MSVNQIKLTIIAVYLKDITSGPILEIGASTLATETPFTNR